MSELKLHPVHDEVYEPAHPGFSCRACGASAPCSWQVEHRDRCRFKALEGTMVPRERVAPLVMAIVGEGVVDPGWLSEAHVVVDIHGKVLKDVLTDP